MIIQAYIEATDKVLRELKDCRRELPSRKLFDGGFWS